MLNTGSCRALTVFFLAACSMCLAQSDQPSLADLARQNRTAKKTVKVLTEDDIPAAQRSAAIAASTAPKEAAGNAAPSAPKSAGDAGKAAATGNGAASVNDLKQALNSNQEQLKGWQRSAQHYESLLEVETNDFRRQMYQDALENDRKNASVFQKKVDQLQSELAAAEKASGGASSAQAGQIAASGK